MATKKKGSAKKVAVAKPTPKKKSAGPKMPKGQWFHAYRWASNPTQVRILPDARGYDTADQALKSPLPRMDPGMVHMAVYVTEPKTP
jgi:hypothetical protein